MLNRPSSQQQQWKTFFYFGSKYKWKENNAASESEFCQIRYVISVYFYYNPYSLAMTKTDKK